MKNVVLLRAGHISLNPSPVAAKNDANYRYFFAAGKQAGIRMLLASMNDFDGRGFRAGVELSGNEWKRAGAFVPHFIFDKSSFSYDTVAMKRDISKVAPYMNPIEIQIMASDKLLTHLAFPSETYAYRLARTQAEYTHEVQAVKTNLVVIKPQYGLGGEGIIILPKKEALKRKIKEPELIQAFVDASQGIPGLYKGVHDLRVLYLGNKPIQAYIRSAAPGTLLCNMALGGCQFHVPLNKIPAKVRAIGKSFQTRFAPFPNSFYTVDFIYDKNHQPKVVEINSNPGLGAAPGNEPYLYATMRGLVKHFVKHAA